MFYTQPESIDISSLPKLPLSDRALFPEVACIYFAVDSQGQVQYIGRSSNLAARWAGHHRYHQLERIDGVHIAYLTLDDPDLLPEVEKALIEWFKPSLNNTRIERRPITRATRPSKEIDLTKIDRPVSITVEEFVEKWGVTRNELSRLIDVPISTMAHWFSPGENRTTPPKVKRSLMYLDYLFTTWHDSAKQFPDARAVFDSCRDRATGKIFKD